MSVPTTAGTNVFKEASYLTNPLVVALIVAIRCNCDASVTSPFSIVASPT